MSFALAPAPPRVRIRHVPEPEERRDLPPPASSRAAARVAPRRDGRRVVLHVGCGDAGPSRLHAIFRSAAWRELRVDLDPAVRPDIVASIADLSAIPDGSCEAVWCSHSLEHLLAHEVGRALDEFRRVLAPDGFALIRSPDLRAVAALVLSHGLDHIAYRSPAGPVTVADMIYGHAPSIARGNTYMRHGTGFTEERLARLLAEAGFASARAAATPDYTVWAAGFMARAEVGRITRALARRGLDLDAGPPLALRPAFA